MTKIFEFPKYEQHPLASKLMPGGMDEAEFTAFCEDVEQRGVIMPITLYEGKVLDGWHRYRAAQRTETAFKELEYKGKDPAGYIASVNVLRRKLGSLQRALVGVRLHLDHNLTQREVCKKLGISNEVVNLVLRAVQSKNAKLIKRIESDTDFTRGMLRDELEDLGLLRQKAPEEALRGPSSVFDYASKPAVDDTDAILGNSPDTDGSSNYEDDDTGPVGNAKPLPDTGKKAAHPERRAKETAAHRLAEQFKALMADEKVSFLEMIWPEARGLAADAGLKYKPETDTAETTPEDALLATATAPSKPTGKAKKPAAKKAAAE